MGMNGLNEIGRVGPGASMMRHLEDRGAEFMSWKERGICKGGGISRKKKGDPAKGHPQNKRG
jgi:hypothetical protein